MDKGIEHDFLAEIISVCRGRQENSDSGHGGLGLAFQYNVVEDSIV